LTNFVLDGVTIYDKTKGGGGIELIVTSRPRKKMLVKKFTINDNRYDSGVNRWRWRTASFLHSLRVFIKIQIFDSIKIHIINFNMFWRGRNTL